MEQTTKTQNSTALCTLHGVKWGSGAVSLLFASGALTSLVFAVLSLLLSLVILLFSAVIPAKTVKEATARYYLAPRYTSSSTTDINNSLVVGAKLIPTLGDYLMTEDTMELALKFAEEWAESPQNGATVDEWKAEWLLEGEYTAKELVEKFTFLAPGEEEEKLTFSVCCTADSAKDSRILLHAFGQVINERSQIAVLKRAYEVEIISEPTVRTVVLRESALATVTEGIAEAVGKASVVFIGVTCTLAVVFVPFFVLALVSHLKLRRADRA